MTVDESSCERVEILASIIDSQVSEALSELTSETAELRLWKRIVQLDPIVLEEMEVESTWSLGRIEYYFPLEIVINNFFNADLDVNLEARINVRHDGENTEMDLAIDHELDVDFDTIEDVLSLGHSASIAKTIEKLLPLVLDCELRKVEQDLLRMIMRFLNSRLNTHRLLAARIVPLGNLSHVAFVLCPLPDEPASGPTAPTDGEVTPIVG